MLWEMETPLELAKEPVGCEAVETVTCDRLFEGSALKKSRKIERSLKMVKDLREVF